MTTLRTVGDGSALPPCDCGTIASNWQLAINK